MMLAAPCLALVILAQSPETSPAADSALPAHYGPSDVEKCFTLTTRNTLRSLNVSLDGAARQLTHSSLEWSTMQIVNCRDNTGGQGSTESDCVRRVLTEAVQLQATVSGSVLTRPGTDSLVLKDATAGIGTPLRTAAIQFVRRSGVEGFEPSALIPGFENTAGELMGQWPSPYSHLCRESWADALYYEGSALGVLCSASKGKEIPPDLLRYWLSPLGDLRFRRQGPRGVNNYLPLVSVGGVSRPSLLGTLNGTLLVDRTETRPDGQLDLVLSFRAQSAASIPDLFLEVLSAFGIAEVSDWSAAESRRAVQSTECRTHLTGTISILLSKDCASIESYDMTANGTVEFRLLGRMPEPNSRLIDATVSYDVECTSTMSPKHRMLESFVVMSSEPSLPIYEWCPR